MMKTRLVGNVQLIGGSADALPELFSLLREEGIEPRGNPDVYVREYRQFGIDEARELRERASSRALRRGSRRVFIIATPSLTSEAQNALLKTLEEPPADALFFLIVRSPHTLLPTLRSRAQMLTLASKEKQSLVDVRAFLSAGAQQRLDMLKPLLEKGEDDKRDLGVILTFLTAVERALVKHPAALLPLYRARKYIGDKGALMKPLLEQVALLIPKV